MQGRSNEMMAGREASFSFLRFAALPSARYIRRSRGVLLSRCPCSASKLPVRGMAFLKRDVTTHNSGSLLEVFRGNRAEFDMRDVLEEKNIFLSSYSPGIYNELLCPQCKGGIEKQQSLSVNIVPDMTFVLWTCNRAQCGWKGHMTVGSTSETSETAINKNHAQAKQTPAEFTEESLKLRPLSKKLITHFATRGISENTLNRNGVRELLSLNGDAIAFPFRKDGKIVSCKFRTLAKKFWQAKNGQKVFYGLDDIKNASEVIIVEGEIDKLSMEEAGYLNCVSVPDGAPAKVSEKVPSEEEIAQDKKFSYIWNCHEYFKKVTRIILATDADAPGKSLAEELARRLGRERCWRVKWPSTETNKCKDANDVLQAFGNQHLCDLIGAAEPYPIRGLFQFRDFFKDLDDYYYLNIGHELGLSTGWDGVDKFYRIVPGEVTLVTGVPNSGKSEWIDALLCNLNNIGGWTFGLCSMENKVREHARKLLEKFLKKPFFDARYANSTPRISKAELDAGKKWLNDNFFLIRCNDEQLPSITWVLDLAKAAVMRHGIRGLVIDPYNELDHQRAFHQTETEYVSQMLTKIRRFAQHHDCHVWFVAHPRQLQSWHGSPPNLYDISGSAHFVNKCDNGIIIHRNRDPKAGPLDRVQVLVRKVRNKAAGTMGDAFLTYDRVTGEYKDYKDIEGS